MSNAFQRFFDRLLRRPRPQPTSSVTAQQSETQARELLEDIVRSVVQILRFNAAVIAVVSEQDGEQRLVVRAFHYDRSLSDLTWGGTKERIQGSVLEIGQRIAGQDLVGNSVSLDDIENLGVRVIRENKPFERTDSLYPLFAPVIKETTAKILQTLAGLNAFVTVPFRAREGALVGNLFVGTREKSISDQQINALNAFARMAGVAVQNAQLLVESERLRTESERLRIASQTQLSAIERQSEQLGALQEIVSAILESTLNKRRVLQSIVDGLVEGFDLRAAMIAVVEQDSSRERILRVKAYSIHRNVPGGRDILERGQKLIGKQLVGAYVPIKEEIKDKNRAVSVILDNKDFERTESLYELWYPAANRLQCNTIQRWLGITSLATVPFWKVDDRTGQRQLIGNIYVATDRSEISNDELRVLHTFALQASNAIVNAELYVQSRRISAIGRQTAHLRHRLNGILGKLGVWTQRIERRVEKEKGQLDDSFASYLTDMLGRISANTREASQAVERISHQATEDVVVRMVDVTSVIDSALNEFELPSGIQVQKNLDEKLPSVEAIELDLVEAVKVLISNAKDAMGNSGELTITSRRVADSVQISVQDTGGGIADEIKDRLFEMGASTKEQGLGFGLWSIRTTLSLFDGHIEYETEQGKGSTFTIFLPVPEGTIP